MEKNGKNNTKSGIFEQFLERFPLGGYNGYKETGKG